MNETFVPDGALPVLRTGVRAGDWIVVSGQVGHVDYRLVEGGVEGEFRQAMQNLRDVVEEHGATMHDLVKVNVYLDDIDDFWTVSDIYREYVDPDQLPARTAVAVAHLPFGALVEIEGWAYVGSR